MIQQALMALFQATFGAKADNIVPMQAHASSRRLFRLFSDRRSVVGVFGPDSRENEAIEALFRHFRSKGFRVPEIYARDPKLRIHLEQDLGEETLFSRLQSLRGERQEFPAEALGLYEAVLEDLVRLQLDGADNFPCAHCTSRWIYDRRAMLWDLHSFKYSFLKLLDVSFNEDKLEDEFESIVSELTATAPTDFMHSDLQARNIMLHEGDLYYIDFQGGRIGPPQYDLASLLYQGSARLSPGVRDSLYDQFVELRGKRVDVEPHSFRADFSRLTFVFLLKALGTYGLRGLSQGKLYFRRGIPLAIENLSYLMANTSLGALYPEIHRVTDEVGALNPASIDGSDSRRVGDPNMQKIAASHCRTGWQTGW